MSDSISCALDGDIVAAYSWLACSFLPEQGSLSGPDHYNGQAYQ